MTEIEHSSAPSSPPSVRWRVPTKIAFRFCSVYFTLYVFCTQMITGLLRTPHWLAPNLGTLPPVSSLVMWVIRHVFHDNRTLAMVGGSGDKMFDWVEVLCLLILAALVTILWSVIDRRRADYARLHQWFRLFLRFALGSTMLSYGAAKAIPLQMSAPSLTRLLEPYGNFSPMGVLWASIGASRPYEIFTGSVEVMCAVLLFIPRTQLAGAALSLAATAQVFTLNMTYDVPVKLFSFHLVLMSLVLLAPDVMRVCRAAFIYRAKWLAVSAQVLFGGYLVWLYIFGSVRSWYGSGGGAPKPPLYGIWEIDRMTIDGVERAPLVTDYDRWRRVVIQGPTAIYFWRMDDTTFALGSTVDTGAKTITISRANNVKNHFTFDQPDAEHLTFDGDFSGRKLHMETHLFDKQRFLLVSRGFNWIQELPFNR